MADEIGGAVVDIDVREGDGIYLIIDNPEHGPRATRKQVLDVLETNGIQDVDFLMITSIFKRDDLHIEECISHNMDIQRSPETAKITVAKDKMSAVIVFSPPVSKGKRLSVDDINHLIDLEGIRFGVSAEQIERLVRSHEYGKEYLFAQGQQSEEGVDGYLKYHFDEKKKTLKPKMTEDGKVDFKSLDLIEKAVKNQVLVTAVKPVLGNDGINVFGQVVAVKPPRPAPMLSAGKNVLESEDGSELIAIEDGQILLDGKRVTVSPVLEINGNVDNSTGNVDFNGSILIRGNVLTGFSVSSVGNIEIMGVVEGAKVKSDHSIILYAGVQGKGVGEITAGESITAKFVENCTLRSGGDITADSIMHSTVVCNGSILLQGRKGMLVGGHTRVAGRLDAMTIGSVMATLTEIEVGLDPYKLQEYRDLQAEYERAKNEYDGLTRMFTTLNQAMKKGILPVDKKVLLLKTINQRGGAREKLEAIQDRIRDILPHLDGEGDVVIVRNIMYTGVKLLIGNASMLVQRQIQYSKLKNIDAKIQILPL